MTKRKVLIPLDGSEFSRQIVQIVRSFFDPGDVELVLFRAAVPPSVTTDLTPHDVFVGGVPMAGSYDAYSRALDADYASVTQERETYRTELQDEMRTEADRLEKAGYKVTTEVHFGDPARRIIDYANDENVNLVAMATHGRTGLGRLVLGSVAERVLRGVAVPVLLMRPVLDGEARPTPGEQLAQSLGDGKKLRIVVATDGSTLAQRAVSKAADLAETLDARLTLLVTVSGREEVAHGQTVMEDARQMVASLSPPAEMVPLVGYADEVLLQYLAKSPADILVIGAFQDRGAGSTTAIGATAQRLVQHAPTSVLMLKGHHPRINKILACVAVDDKAVVDVSAQLARATHAELRLLHVVPPSAASYLAAPDSVDISLQDVLTQGTHLSSLLRDWIAQLESQGLGQEEVFLRSGSVPEAILRVAHDGGFDLIVVGSQSGPGHFLGSVANGVVRYAEQSVLIVRTRLD